MLVDPDVMDPALRTFHETKHFYRRLDGLLTDLITSPAGERLLDSYVARLVDEFASDLGFFAAAIYRERRGELALEKQFGAALRHAEQLDARAPGIELAIERHVVLFRAGEEANFGLPSSGDTESGALVVIEEPRERHVIVFRFRGDAAREQVEFALNTARSALAARLLEQRLGGALREAAAIQSSLLPERAPDFRGYDIAGASRAAEEVGGDLFDFLAIDEDTLGLSIGDASGHGLPAALVARDVVVALRMGVEGELKIRHTLRKLNRVVHSSNLSSGFVSLFYGELEANGNLFFVNAGHEPPLYCAGGSASWMPRGGPVLGPLPEAEFKSHFLHVDRDTTLVLYTDGIIERSDKDGVLFGCDGLTAAVQSALGSSSATILERVFAAAEAHGGGAPWDDDATVVVVHRLA
ncbi:MAG: PP2C family protein-serine/threonine phosphatase [Planctomycetota bacterium]